MRYDKYIDNDELLNLYNKHRNISKVCKIINERLLENNVVGSNGEVLQVSITCISNRIKKQVTDYRKNSLANTLEDLGVSIDTVVNLYNNMRNTNRVAEVISNMLKTHGNDLEVNGRKIKDLIQLEERKRHTKILCNKADNIRRTFEDKHPKEYAYAYNKTIELAKDGKSSRYIKNYIDEQYKKNWNIELKVPIKIVRTIVNDNKTDIEESIQRRKVQMRLIRTEEERRNLERKERIKEEYTRNYYRNNRTKYCNNTDKKDSTEIVLNEPKNNNDKNDKHLVFTNIDKRIINKWNGTRYDREVAELLNKKKIEKDMSYKELAEQITIINKDIKVSTFNIAYLINKVRSEY